MSFVLFDFKFRVSWCVAQWPEVESDCNAIRRYFVAIKGTEKFTVWCYWEKFNWIFFEIRCRWHFSDTFIFDTFLSWVFNTFDPQISNDTWHLWPILRLEDQRQIKMFLIYSFTPFRIYFRESQASKNL